MPLCHLFLAYSALHMDADLYLYQSDQVCHKQFHCLSGVLLFIHVFRQVGHPGNHLIVRSCIPRIITIILDCHAAGEAVVMPQHDMRYSLMACFVPAISALLTLGSTSVSF